MEYVVKLGHEPSSRTYDKVYEILTRVGNMDSFMQFNFISSVLTVYKELGIVTETGMRPPRPINLIACEPIELVG